MAAPFKYKLTIYQGSTFRFHATWKTGTPAAAVDLTGYTARMQIRATVDSTEILFSLTTENGGIALGDAAGTIDLYIAHTATALIDWADEGGVYDLELVTPSGDVVRKMYGAVVVKPEVTR